MNREMRRLMEREERRQKKQDKSGAAKRRGPGVARPTHGEKKSWPERIRAFFHDVRQEMKRVSWPTQEQMIAFTAVTLITTAALTLVVFGLDIVMKEVVLFVVQRG
ncbi:MAG: preprotein translocase subunit SecE [Acidimicrobiia bacterium]